MSEVRRDASRGTNHRRALDEGINIDLGELLLFSKSNFVENAR
jgi:hypothetical protein